MNSYGLRNLFPRLFPRLTWRRADVGKTIYLTFDDGPVEGVTEWVLDLLKEKKVKATFFVVGDNVKKYPAVMQRVANEQTFANHTFHHVKGWSYTLEQYLGEVKHCDEIMREITGDSMSAKSSRRLFRPPYGRITGKQVKALLPDYELIMWDVLTGDYDKHLNIEKAFQRSCKETRSGSIIVFHDSYKAEKQMKQLLPRYIDYCLSQGYTFDWL
ncbi:MAG: polysaccharide deacetylase family protein [Cytophagaceae bacterium]|jgi:peptidoglycan/xylan/chitin deacetylase (PgdA/CDA1 family)|nr:polysaccharide deacetylase family protein [Cytophagaceae bacterium]